MQIDSNTLEQIANQALYSTNLQTKRAAEQHLWNYLSQTAPNNYRIIFENHSSNVVFASASCLAFWTDSFKPLENYLDSVNKILRSWFRQHDGRFIRSNNQELQPHCVNTILKFLGKALKNLYLVPKMQRQVIDWLETGEQGDKYRLFLFYSFIEQVSLFDSSLGFIPYKTLLQNFQESVIPQMLVIFYPYFMNFSQAMEVAGLTEMQSNLSLDGNQNSQQSQPVVNNVVQVMFRLLEQIVSFRYNLNYHDFDQGELSRSKVSFPEPIIQVIIKRDFLQALYTLMGRLLEIGNTIYFNKCLDCLEKILDARVMTIPKDLLSKFIAINLRGIVELQDSLLNKNHGNISCLEHLVICIPKFQDIFSFCELKVLQQLDSTCQEYFLSWVKLSFRLPLAVLEANLPLHGQSELFLGSVNIIRNMGNDIHHLKLEGIVLKDVMEGYQTFVDAFFQKFFSSNSNIQGTVDFSNIQTLKRYTIKFFEHLVPVCSLFYDQVFTFINGCLTSQCQQLDKNALNITNLFLFVAAMINNELFFEADMRNHQPLLMKQGRYVNEKTATTIGSLMANFLDFIDLYSQNPHIQPLNHALVLFYEALLSRFTIKLEVNCQNENPPTDARDQLFRLLLWANNSEQHALLMRFMNGISRLVRHSHVQCMEFIMHTLHQSISNIKRAYIRKDFRNMPIFQELLNMLNALAGTQVSRDALRWRVQLFRTLALLCYDDELDDYRSNIRSSIHLIKPSNQQELNRVLYDLTGILEGIDSTRIYEYFMGKMLLEINYGTLINALFSRFKVYPHLLKDVLHLTYLIIRRRSDAPVHVKSLFQLIMMTFPYWNDVLNQIKDNTNYVELFDEYYLIIESLIGEKHINLSLLETYTGEEVRNIRQFIMLVFLHFQHMLAHIDELPESRNKYYKTVGTFITSLMPYLYNSPDTEPAESLTSFLNTLMAKIAGNFDKIIVSEYPIDQLEKQLKLCQQFFSFFIDSLPFQHHFVVNHHIPRLPTTTPDCLEFLAAALKLGLNFGPSKKEIVIINTLSQICFDMCRLYQNFDIDKMSQHIGLQKKKDFDQFSRIVSSIREEKELDWMLYQVKDWFKEGLRFSDSHNESSNFEGY